MDQVGIKLTLCSMEEGFPGGSDAKEFVCNAGGLGLFCGSERSPGEGNGNPLQYSSLENSMDRHSLGLKELDTTERLHFLSSYLLWRLFFSLVSANRGSSLVVALGFSLGWLLVVEQALGHVGFCSFGSQALEHRLNSCGTRAPQHVGSSQIRD